MIVKRTPGAVLLLGLVLSGAPVESAQQKADQSADMQAIASYRLTMPTVRKVAAAMQTVAAAMQKDPKVRELQGIKDAIAGLEAKMENGTELTEAEEKRLEELKQKEEALENADDDEVGSAGTIAEMEAAVRKEPVLLNALQREGVAPREYATFMMAYIQAAMVHGMQKQGLLKEVPAGVNRENLAFMAQHEAELADIQKQFEALGRKPRR
jgi:hypothetical protein